MCVCVCVCECVCVCVYIIAGLKKLGYKTTNKKLDHIMKELDRDQDGNVEFTGLGFRV